MKRRAFLQSVLAGGAVIALPTRTVRAKDQSGDVEYVFELGEVNPMASVACSGFQFEVPARGQCKVTFVPHKGDKLQPLQLLVPIEPGHVQLQVMELTWKPVDAVYFAELDPERPNIDAGVYADDRPIQMVLRSLSGEAETVYVAWYMREVSRYAHPCPPFVGPEPK